LPLGVRPQTRIFCVVFTLFLLKRLCTL